MSQTTQSNQLIELNVFDNFNVFCRNRNKKSLHLKSRNLFCLKENAKIFDRNKAKMSRVLLTETTIGSNNYLQLKQKEFLKRRINYLFVCKYHLLIYDRKIMTSLYQRNGLLTLRN